MSTATSDGPGETHSVSWPGRGRVFFSARTLLYDRLRLAISVGGMTFAVVLVLLLRGIMDGTVEKSTTYVDNVGADVFVARTGVKNMALSVSVLPEELVSELAALPGVTDASGIVRVHVTLSEGDRRQPGELVGYEPGSRLGGPWRVTAGRPPATTGEAALDSVLASRLRVGIGDQVAIGGQDFVITGLTGETVSIAGKLVFVTLADARVLLQSPESVSFVLLKIADPASAPSVAESITAQFDGTQALTRAELSGNDRDMLGDLFVAPINVMSTVGFLVGLAVIGLTMYTMTSERLRDFGVLKAIGAPHGFLLRTVIGQATVLGVTGFAIGLAVTILVGPVVVQFVPDIGVKVNWEPSVRTLAAVVGMSLLGAVVPVLRIVRVDPLLVFRR
ncbi:MAG: FtsX-like permease family protein [Dehalococcoidia bacterium]|nr:FtsX-like permease family protein [Dehalococcoidia bacterium]